MSFQVRAEPEASAELEEAVLWYEQHHAGLGTEFLEAIDEAITLIEQWPHAAPRVPSLPDSVPARKAPVQRFPYIIVYLIANETIRILAFAHERRRPNYWRSRITNEL